MTSEAASPPAPTRRQAFRFWLLLGFVSFGGPAGQIAIMHRELVERRRWFSERRFLHALNFCMLLPGPEAMQLATYLGWLLHRTWGGIVAGVLFVLPSLAILVALSWIYLRYGHVPEVAGALAGVKPAVVAIVLHAAWRIGRRTLRSAWAVAIAVGAFVAIEVLAAPFPAIVLAAALVGMAIERVRPGRLVAGAAHVAAAGPHAAAVIDDATPPPPHARFSRAGLVRVTLACLGLFAAGIGVVLALDRDGLFLAMAWLFTKAALVTFGGAYAVLPYLVTMAVEHYGWLTAGQMIDGLALGETTPGPLIMVVAYVGFVAGWAKAAFGPEALALAGIVGACVATFFTFLPSFFFVLAGGPMIEATHGDVRVAAPLAGVTAAVVGVIVSLALFFGVHVLWPDGIDPRAPWSGLDAWASALFLAATLLLFSERLGVIPLVLLCAGVGLVRVLVV